MPHILYEYGNDRVRRCGFVVDASDMLFVTSYQSVNNYQDFTMIPLIRLAWVKFSSFILLVKECTKWIQARGVVSYKCGATLGTLHAQSRNFVFVISFDPHKDIPATANENQARVAL